MLYLLPTVQPPPRGVWGEGGVTTFTSMESYLGEQLPAEPPVHSVDDLVRRALGALGPARVMDVQAWSRLTRLREVFDRLEPRCAGSAARTAPSSTTCRGRRGPTRTRRPRSASCPSTTTCCSPTPTCAG